MDNDKRNSKPDFSVTLTPHRSLGKKGFVVLMVVISCVCFLAGLLFFMIGAWPVVGFFGLDALLIWLAFKLNYRSARAYEEVVLTENHLTIRKVSASGKISESAFNPRWTRLEIQEQRGEGVTRIAVCSGSHRVSVGAFLNPDDRTSFAKAFQGALLQSRTA